MTFLKVFLYEINLKEQLLRNIKIIYRNITIYKLITPQNIKLESHLNVEDRPKTERSYNFEQFDCTTKKICYNKQ